MTRKKDRENITYCWTILARDEIRIICIHFPRGCDNNAICYNNNNWVREWMNWRWRKQAGYISYILPANNESGKDDRWMDNDMTAIKQQMLWTTMVTAATTTWKNLYLSLDQFLLLFIHAQIFYSTLSGFSWDSNSGK